MEEEGLLFHNPERPIHVKASTSEPGLTNSTLGAHNMSQMMPSRESTINFFLICLCLMERIHMDG